MATLGRFRPLGLPQIAARNQGRCAILDGTNQRLFEAIHQHDFVSELLRNGLGVRTRRPERSDSPERLG